MAGDEKNSAEQQDLHPSPDQPAAAGPPSSDAPAAPAAAPVAVAQVNSGLPDDELPDFEPLTPELVEEEAIRGDFMLRWAVIFLALLFGFSKLTETRTLVHIRAGDQLRATGFLPERVDTLSFSAAGQPVSNVSWLFDHVVSGVWAVGGATGLSLFKAVLAAFIAWVLVHISVPGMPTWWGSICAALAVVACSADLMPMTELMTLLGMTLLLKLLHQHREGTASGLLWKLPLLIAVWCNLDTRAWIGALVVVLYAVGWGLRGRRSASESAAAGASGSLLLESVAAVLALLVNPFPLNSLLTPSTMYAVEYPAMQDQRPLSSSMARVSFDGRVDYFSLLSPDAFLLFDHTQIAALAVILTAVIVLLLARSRDDLGYVLALAGLTLLAVIATHELPVAALLAAMVAGTTAQRWYRRNFTLQYSTNPGELLVSRGGRAATVFAMAFLGFGVVAGRLPGHTPVGFGFDRELQTTLDTLGAQLSDIDPESRILHTRIDQGDMLIWHGRKSMIDSRLVPFGRPGNPESIIAQHRVMLSSLMQRQPEPANDDDRQQQAAARTAAQASLDTFQITHAMPRLSPPGPPDYRSVEVLSANPEWLMISLGASAALLERIAPDLPSEEKQKKLPKFGLMAFQDAKPAALPRPDFAREPSFYQRHVYRERPWRDQYLRQAEHYLWLSQAPVRSLDEALYSLALVTLTVRNLNQSLFLEPQNTEAYRMLGIAYQQLGELETLISGQPGDSTRQQMRYLQSVMALRQALKGSPKDALVWEVLFQQYRSRQKKDLALECLDQWLPLQEGRLDDVEVEAAIKEMFEMQRQLKEEVAAQEERLDEFQSTTPAATDPQERSQQILSMAAGLVQLGFDRRALQILDENEELVQQNPVSRVLRGRLLMESGELEDGFTVINQVAAIAREQPQVFVGTGWHFPAAVSQLSVADYGGVIDYWKAQLEEIDEAGRAVEPRRDLLLTMPLAGEVAMLPQAMLPQWPVGHLGALQIPTQGLSNARAETRFLMALSHIEEGNTQSARTLLQSIVAECGSTPYRNLVSFYLALIDDNAAQFIEQNTLNDWEDFDATWAGDVVAPSGADSAPATGTSPASGTATPAPATPGAATPGESGAAAPAPSPGPGASPAPGAAALPQGGTPQP